MVPTWACGSARPWGVVPVHAAWTSNGTTATKSKSIGFNNVPDQMPPNPDVSVVAISVPFTRNTGLPVWPMLVIAFTEAVDAIALNTRGIPLYVTVPPPASVVASLFTKLL